MTRPDDPGDDHRDATDRDALDGELDTEQVVEDAIEYFGAAPGAADSPTADADAPPPG